MVLALLRAGAPVDTPSGWPGSTLLGNACSDGYLDIVQCLIDHGASIDNGSKHPVVIAAKSGHLHIIQYFLARPDIDLAVLRKALEAASSEDHSAVFMEGFAVEPPKGRLAVVNELVLRVDFPDVWDLTTID